LLPYLFEAPDSCAGVVHWVDDLKDYCWFVYAFGISYEHFS
jgi:hypothetical protein